MNKQKINIPFDGFYNSILEHAIDQEIESFIENQNDPEFMRGNNRTEDLTYDNLEINYKEIFREKVSNIVDSHIKIEGEKDE